MLEAQIEAWSEKPPIHSPGLLDKDKEKAQTTAQEVHPYDKILLSRDEIQNMFKDMFYKEINAIEEKSENDKEEKM